MTWAKTGRIDELLACPAILVADLAMKLAAVLYVCRQIRSLDEARPHWWGFPVVLSSSHHLTPRTIVVACD